MEHNKLIEVEWARIPHFYNSFYVYKYATGITSAVSIAKKVLDGNTQGYFKFLSAGSSLSPLEILKLADVDMTTSKPFDDAMLEFADCFGQLSRLV